MSDASIDWELCRRVRPMARKSDGTVAALLAGRLVMRPHPEFELPLPNAIDWRADPFGDLNWRVQFNMLRWLDPLREAGEDGHHEAFIRWAQYAKSWVEHNPPASDNRDAWMDMQDGLRAQYLVAGAPMIAASAPQELEWLIPALVTHGEWLSDEAHLGKANHALHQHQGLVVLGAVLKRADWVDLAWERLQSLFRESWDPQGVNNEGAIAYHYNNLTWWREAIRVFSEAGCDAAPMVQGIKATELELAHATRPDGTLVTIGDTDPARVPDMDNPVIQWVRTGGAKGEPPAETLAVYDDGYIFGRSGWGEFERHFSDETYFSITFGRHKIHGHPDGSALTYSAGGVNWVVDPGKHSYSHQGPIRRHMVAHDSHSLCYLDGREYQTGTPVTLDRKSITDDVYDFQFTDLGYPRTKIQRRVVYSRSGEYLVVIDRVTSAKDFTAVQRWQLGPGVVATAGRNSVALEHGDQRGVLATFGNAPALAIKSYAGGDSAEGLVSAGWKQTDKADAVEFRKSGTLARFITVLAAGTKGTPNVERVAGLPTNILGFRVDTGRSQETLVVTPKDAQIYAYNATPEALQGETSTQTVPAAKDAHLNSARRAEAESLCLAAQEAIWNGASATERQALEQEMTAKARQLGKFDLGLWARLADLRGSLEPNVSSPTTRLTLVNPENNNEWRPTSYPYPVVSHRSTLRAELVGDPEIHVVDLGQLVLPMLYLPGKEPVLTVSFHGALDRSKTQLPMFQRVRGQQILGVGHALFVSDPTLDLASHMRLGWYLGTKDLDVHAHIARAIDAIREQLGLEYVVLQGSSGGGFASLHIASLLKNAVASVDDPQTDTRQYSAVTQELLYRASFGTRQAPTDPALTQRLSASERAAADSFPSAVHYHVNTGDEVHRKKHAEPYQQAAKRLGNADQLIRTDELLGTGHRAAPQAKYAERLSAVYRSLGFEPIPQS